MLEDAELEPGRACGSSPASLLGDPERLGGMARRVAALARPDAAERVAAELLGAIGESLA